MKIYVDNWDKGRRVSLVEGRALMPATGPADAEELEFTLTLYPDQVSLNIPATAGGRGFIDRLTQILGPPSMEPTVKCSCSWGNGVMGAMYLVLWDLAPATATQTFEDLRTFLQASPA